MSATTKFYSVFFIFMALVVVAVFAAGYHAGYTAHLSAAAARHR